MLLQVQQVRTYWIRINTYYVPDTFWLSDSLKPWSLFFLVIRFSTQQILIHVLPRCAGVGQSRIMRLYCELFETVGLKISQLLVSQRDFLEQQRWTEIRNTICACLEAGVIPVINENDTTNTDGVRFGDNDNLAALTAVQLEAAAVFLFTDVDYLYTANPNVDPEAEPMKLVSEAFELQVDTREPGSSLGTGGMSTKIAAARTAHCAGIPCGILHGRYPERIYSFLSRLDEEDSKDSSNSAASTKTISSGKSVSSAASDQGSDCEVDVEGTLFAAKEEHESLESCYDLLSSIIPLVFLRCLPNYF